VPACAPTPSVRCLPASRSVRPRARLWIACTTRPGRRKAASPTQAADLIGDELRRPRACSRTTSMVANVSVEPQLSRSARPLSRAA
jgi:hypothetical protein